MQPSFRVLSASLCIFATSSFAQVAVIEVMSSAETAAAEFAIMAADIRNAEMAAQRAEVIGSKYLALVKEFASAKKMLESEKKRLVGNPEANKAELARMAKAEASLDKARQRLDLLGPKLKDTPSLIAAVKSKFLERTSKEVKDGAAEAKGAIAAAAESINKPVGDGVGSIEVRELKVVEGRGVKLMLIQGGAEIELKPSVSVALTGLPAKVRVELIDDNKERLVKQKKDGSLPKGTSFEDDAGGCLKDRFFAYANPAVGRTEWRSEEKVTWTTANSDSQAKLRGFISSNSDTCAKGDVVELSPAASTAQGINLEVIAETVWHRSSKLAAGAVRKEDVTPKDGRVHAFVTLSIFGK